MKTKKTLQFLFALFFLTGIFFACKTTTEDKDNIPLTDTPVVEDIPEPDIDSTQTGRDTISAEVPDEYSIPKELSYIKLSDNLLIDRFYPIGWSADGKFAYICEPTDEACGCYFFKIAVQDMVTDKEIWKWDFNDEGEGENLESVWWKHYKEFKTKLHKYKIIQSTNIQLQKSPIDHKGNHYVFDMDVEMTQDTDFGFDVMKSVVIKIESEQLGKKRFHRYYEKDYPMVLNTKLTGYVLNPYEDRIFLMRTEECRGYEGPPNVVSFVFAGCQLTEGFSK